MTVLRSHAPDEAAITALELEAIMEAEVWNSPRREVSKIEAERRAWLGLEPESEMVDADLGDYITPDATLASYLRRCQRQGAA